MYRLRMIKTSSTVTPSRGLAKRAAKLFNHLTLPLSGTRWLPLWAVIHHRGRRSGKPYATPIASRRMQQGFLVALAWGESADWVRNIQAAGDAVIRWKGRDYSEVDPQVVDWTIAKANFNAVERAVLRRAGINRFLLLRDAAPDPR
jgi:deazaflavin-dependent oxidoreductase (nitroreductase family)